MYSNRLRLVLGVVSILFAAFYFSEGHATGGVVALVAAGLLLYGYWRYGTVWLAFHQLKAQRFEKADALLAQVRSPQALSKEQRAYYELSKGAIALQRHDGQAADAHLRAALSIGLRTRNDEAVAEYSLAQAAVLRDDAEEAMSFLAAARSKARKPTLVALVDELQAMLEEEPVRPAHQAAETSARLMEDHGHTADALIR